jgi:hypothetical protein
MVAIGWQFADLFTLRAASETRKRLTLLGTDADNIIGGSGSEVRIILGSLVRNADF